MEIGIEALISIITGAFAVIAFIIRLAVLQYQQNSRITDNEKGISKLTEKLRDQTEYQIRSEKDIVEIQAKLGIERKD